MGTFIVGGVLLAIVAAIVIKLVRDKKKGGGCGCGCTSCPHASSCGGDKKTSDTDTDKEE
ncbi:FeoB-associated Cys-rich membrane protein [Eubacterium aggregans]|uniref:Virus attachment protein p12 family protein n=1 Tax=Eubacterium aggregans TaxID=81409 RepID=A0A1H3YQP1_9FIRM|nr:FeoB-associated Cys-rich membrane protein [Eubacterium aggregans]MDD4691535.1 FeoB-associated Cys-rich membrane protein [Eubacterium aggregans]SEA13889.1 Virus attachment protein p12 family protein [Eubacterium aggregans]